MLGFSLQPWFRAPSRAQIDYAQAMRMSGSPKVRATLALLLSCCALRWALSSRASPASGAAAPARHALHESGILSYEVRDAQTQKPIPAKLTLIGIRGTADPALSPGMWGVRKAMPSRPTTA